MQKSPQTQKQGVIFYSLLFILHLEALWGLDVQFLECVCLARGRLGASRACPQWAFVLHNAGVTGAWNAALCPCESLLCLTAWQLRRCPLKRQDSSSSHPHFLSAVYRPLNGFALTRETKEPFRPRLSPQPARSGLLLMCSVPPFSPGSLTLIVSAAPEQH